MDASREPEGCLRWGVKRSFREYVTAADDGYVHATKGARLNEDGTVDFPLAGIDRKGSVLVALRFAGGIDFGAHAGLLSIRLRSPWLEFDEATIRLSVAQSADAGPTCRRLPFCDVAAVASEPGTGELRISDAPTTLTMEAASVFDYLYIPGTALDPVTAVISW